MYFILFQKKKRIHELNEILCQQQAQLSYTEGNFFNLLDVILNYYIILY